jgi:hypothetical protein
MGAGRKIVHNRMHLSRSGPIWRRGLSGLHYTGRRVAAQIAGKRCQEMRSSGFSFLPSSPATTAAAFLFHASQPTDSRLPRDG